MPLPNDGIQPDRFELRVRFIFGALAGALILVRLATARSTVPL